MTSVFYALKELNQARNERDALLHIFNCIERTEGVGCEKLKAFTTDKINPSLDSVDKAEKVLRDAEPRTQTEALQKVAALMQEDIDQEDIAVLRAEALAFTRPNADPIVQLCRRWLLLRKVRSQMLMDCPTGNFDGPDFIRVEEDLLGLETDILRLTPASPEGVALLAEMQYVNEGPDGLPGTEGWAAEMNNPQYLVMRRLAHGARLVAGAGV